MGKATVFIDYFSMPRRLAAPLPRFVKPDFYISPTFTFSNNCAMKLAIKFSLMALFMLAGLAVYAQPGGGGRMMNPEQRAEQQTAQMTEKLSLSEAQAAKVKEINLKYAKQGQEAREKADGDWEAMRGTMTAIRQEQDKELQTVMTQEQWDQWVKVREEFRGNRGFRGGDKPAPTPDDKDGKKEKKEKKSDSDSGQ